MDNLSKFFIVLDKKKKRKKNNHNNNTYYIIINKLENIKQNETQTNNKT
jgi:hypothetical protein